MILTPDPPGRRMLEDVAREPILQVLRDLSSVTKYGVKSTLRGSTAWRHSSCHATHHDCILTPVDFFVTNSPRASAPTLPY
jgi:hypothetical protein